MQSTVRALAPSEVSTTIQFLADCLNETGFEESLDSQAETSGRCNEIAAFTLMQQSRRMLQRPLSIAGVELADGNRFFVNLGSQAETCARPLVINDTMFNRPTPHHQTPRHQTPRHQTPNHQTPNHQTPHHQTPHHQEELKMPTATYTTPFAWDFRAQSNAVDAIGVDRSWDWPALDENSYRQPSSTNAKVWSKQPSLSRIPALVKRQKASAADAECLRELLYEAMNREAQRITCRTKAFKTEAKSADEFPMPFNFARNIATKLKLVCARFFVKTSWFWA